MSSAAEIQRPDDRQLSTDERMQLTLKGFLSRRHSVVSYPLTMGVSEPIGSVLAFLCCRIGFTPNLVTVLSGVFSTLGAAALVLVPVKAAAIPVAFVLLQLGYALDCADGQLARAKGLCSPFGAWLDVAIDFLTNVTLPVAVSVVAIRSTSSTQQASSAILGCVLLIYGKSLFLHTSTLKRKQGGKVRTDVSLLVDLFRMMSDHTTFLAIMCFTCVLPASGISAVLVLYGLLYTSLAFRAACSLV